MKPTVSFLAASLLAPFAIHADAHATQAKQPNVLLIITDDQGYGDFSIHGNAHLQTPNIDKLGRESVRFDRFYVDSFCAPTRAALLTGRWPLRTGVHGVTRNAETMRTSEVTIAEALGGGGYRSACIGKWHNGEQYPFTPTGQGFDEAFGFNNGHWNAYFDPVLLRGSQPEQTKGYITDVLTDEAMKFITKNKNTPFFCYLSYNAPHSPYQVPDRYFDKFKAKGFDNTVAAFYGMCENLDENVGRLLAHLEAEQLADNTIVFYFSDNGPNSFRWNGGMKNRKGSTDEGGVRSVGYLRWPAKIPAGQRIEQIAGAIDLLPTITSLAGIARVGSAPLDGRDLSPLVLGQNVNWPDRMIFNAWNTAVSVRTQQHRLDSTGRLFDMVADYGQQRDIAAEHPGIAKKLSDAASAWRKDMLGGASVAALADATNAKGKKRANAAGAAILPPDDRPYTVGYAEFPLTMLPARDGVSHGSIKRSSNAPNSSYFVNWTNLTDKITWDVDVHSAGTYDVTIDYTCPVPDAGSTVELSFKQAKLTGKVSPGFDQPLYTNQDTIPRPAGESQMKEFRVLALGTVQLEKGRGPLTLRALQIPGASVMDVRRVNLTLRK